MKKIFFIITFFFLIHSVFSQIKSGKIIYRTKETAHQSLPDEVKKDPSIISLSEKLRRKAQAGLPLLRHELQFNANEATYKRAETMDIDENRSIALAEARTRSEGIYYVNREQNTQLHQFELMGEYWIMKAKPDTISWKIQNETKEIKGYKVQKATATVPLNNKVQGEVTAWFASEIPFSFGPIGLSGLPGLILEYEIYGYAHYVEQINLSEKDLKINKPTKGKVVTKSELDSYIRQSFLE